MDLLISKKHAITKEIQESFENNAISPRNRERSGSFEEINFTAADMEKKIRGNIHWI